MRSTSSATRGDQPVGDPRRRGLGDTPVTLRPCTWPGLKVIDPTLREVAQIDGANGWESSATSVVLPVTAADQRRRRRRHDDRGAAELRHRLRHEPRHSTGSRSCRRSTTSNILGEGDPDRLRLRDRRHPARDLAPRSDLRLPAPHSIPDRGTEVSVTAPAAVRQATGRQSASGYRVQRLPTVTCSQCSTIAAVIWLVPVWWLLLTRRSGRTRTRPTTATSRSSSLADVRETTGRPGPPPTPC